ncbi:MAG: hypothetical protein ACLTQH_00460 [Fusobacterium sp.]
MLQGGKFIGSHLSENFALGHRVIVIDNFHEFYPLGIKIRNILESTDNKELIKDFRD